MKLLTLTLGDTTFNLYHVDVLPKLNYRTKQHRYRYATLTLPRAQGLSQIDVYYQYPVKHPSSDHQDVYLANATLVEVLSTLVNQYLKAHQHNQAYHTVIHWVNEHLGLITHRLLSIPSMNLNRQLTRKPLIHFNPVAADLVIEGNLLKLNVDHSYDDIITKAK